MPDANVDDLDRSNETDPAASRSEYVRWQRGPLTETPMSLMKSWVDKTEEQDNVWLVLVFHGVDGIGWKPKTGAELKDFLGYIHSKIERLWVATFQDVAKYIRERGHSTVASYKDGSVISVVLRSDLTDLSYDLPLTLQTSVPTTWRQVEVRQGAQTRRAPVMHAKDGSYVLYQAAPNGEVVTLSEAAEDTRQEFATPPNR
jgi:hypothetical protein